ncbi:MAG: hypothetical protein IJO91_04005, partial [Oscillospiraceae bacterium]|nr:hypothetical protein [Oscillospiraceae bacterium]
MNSKRFSTMVLAAAMMFSLTACSGADANSNSSSTSEDTTAASQNTTTASTTSATTTKPAEPDIPDIDVNGEDCVIVNYGWDIDDTDCMARIYCPEGAEFDDYTLQVQANDGWVLTADISDEVNEYSATSISH